MPVNTRMAAAHVESEDHPDQEPSRSPQVQIVPVKTNGEDVGDTLLKAIMARRQAADRGEARQGQGQRGSNAGQCPQPRVWCC